MCLKGHFLLGGERTGGGRSWGRGWPGEMRLGSWDPGPKLGGLGPREQRNAKQDSANMLRRGVSLLLIISAERVLPSVG